jgi:cytochrome P450 family 135
MPGLRADLPPGPRAPLAVQTVQWVTQPTTLLRRAQARHGEPFTLRMAWSDAPMVLTSDPEEIRRIYAAPSEVLEGGAGAAFLVPFTGPRSLLVLDGPEHLRQRKLVLPAFHGEALRRWTDAIAALANGELDRWAPGRPLRTLPRMQALTLEVIMRVVFGTDDPALRGALRRALDMTQSTPRLVAMALVRRDLGRFSPYGRFLRAVAALDAVLEQRIASAAADGSILAVLRAVEPDPNELRDQLVTLLAAGHETTATALAWAFERLARHPAALAALRDASDDALLDATVKEVLRVRPVLSATSRRVRESWRVGGYTLPAGVYVAPCLYLAHRRAELWNDPAAFRPERFLEGAPEPFSWIPFGGGVRRCVGAAFASLEMREVLRAAAARFALAPDRPEGERVRRRSITLAPARGGRVIPYPLA